MRVDQAWTTVHAALGPSAGSGGPRVSSARITGLGRMWVMSDRQNAIRVPAAAVYALGMQRSDVTRDDGTWVGLSLDVQGRHQPGLCVFTAGAQLLVSQMSQPVLLAVVDAQHEDVDFWRTNGYRSFVPPLRADAGRALAGSPERWAHRFAQYLIDSPGSPLHEGRWLLSCESPLRHWRHADTSHAEYWNSMLVDGHPHGYIDWFLHAHSWEVLPLRPMPDADDSRVKAYRKPVKGHSHPSCCGGSVAWTAI
ncbi:hypothetical protein GCM10009540_07240 [Streptomyces turgidiscabies]